MKLGLTSGKDCPPCGCVLDGVQAVVSRRSPRAIADFDINLALSLCRALPAPI
jgi:hypothetical protein